MESGSNPKPETGPHSLSLKDRKHLEMDGIKEVISFNDSQVTLQSNQGGIGIKGRDLNIQKLNLEEGHIRIDGFISSLEYTDRSSNKGLLTRLFK